MVNCTIENTASVGVNGCGCYRGYYGKSCELHFEWYPAALLVIHAVETAIELIIIAWIALLLVYNVRRKGLNFNVALVAQLLQFFAAIVRIVGLWIPNRAALGSRQDFPLTTGTVVLVYSYLTLLMISSVICVGFWYDILKKVGRHGLHKKTIWLISAGSGAFLVGSIVGMIMIIMGNVMGSILVIITLIANLIGITVTVVYIKRMKLEERSVNATKRDWVVRNTIVVTVFWFLYVCFMALVPFLPTSSPLSIGNDYGFRICEIVIGIFLVRLIDFKHRSFTVLTGKTPETSSVTVTVSKDTTSNGSKGAVDASRNRSDGHSTV